jgi:nucleoid-associated protein YgaU
MIAILLLLFGIMSKLDRLVPMPKDSQATLPPPLTLDAPDSQRNRVVSVIGDPAQPTLPVAPPTTTTPKKPAVEDTKRPPLPTVEVKPGSEADSRPPRICPRKPRKGDKLVDSPKIADASKGIPATGNQNGVPGIPEVQKTYRGQRGTTSPSSVASKPQQRARRYTIRKDETLWSIARRFYGNGKYYSRIEKANPGFSHDTMKPGQVITIPLDGTLMAYRAQE